MVANNPNSELRTPNSRADWIADRKNYIGGSEVAAIFNKHPYLTPLMLWEIKTGHRATPDITDINSDHFSYPAWFGTEAEEILAKYFRLKTGYNVYPVDETVTHPQFSFIRGHIDRRGETDNGTPFILEIKTTSGYNRKKYADGEIPDFQEFQIRYYMWLYNYDLGYLIVHVGDGRPPVIEQFIRDDYQNTLERLMLEGIVAYWKNYIEQDIEPPVSDSKIDGDIMLGRYPQADDTDPITIDDPDYISDATTYIDILAQENTITKKKQGIKNRLMKQLETIPTAHCGDYIISWKNKKGSQKANYDLLKEKYPDAYAECVTEQKPTRVFTIKENTYSPPAFTSCIDFTGGQGGGIDFTSDTPFGG